MVLGQHVQTGTGNVREQKDVLGFSRDNSGSVFQSVPLSSVYSQQEASFYAGHHPSHSMLTIQERVLSSSETKYKEMPTMPINRGGKKELCLSTLPVDSNCPKHI